MMIDTHCHLSFPDFDTDFDAVMARATNANVSAFLTIGTGPDDWHRCLKIAASHPSIRVALGIHPNESNLFTQKTLDELTHLATTHPSVVAIGETGLDYYRETAPRDKQRESFIAHLDLAEKLKRPFILHCRAAEDEMLTILEERYRTENLTYEGVWHCFGAAQTYAERAMKLGLYFGLGGVTTYPKSTDVRSVLATLPADRIVLETDCPFLPPQGWRGKRNEPSYLTKVVDVLATTRGTRSAEIERITTENAQRLFGDW